ncbi:MAG: hypothetical protein ACTSUH_09900, partial [Candidatus Thorarchaeota archaeon]
RRATASRRQLRRSVVSTELWRSRRRRSTGGRCPHVHIRPIIERAASYFDLMASQIRLRREIVAVV